MLCDCDRPAIKIKKVIGSAKNSCDRRFAIENALIIASDLRSAIEVH